MHPLAIPASGDDSRAPQIRKVAGDFGLRTAQDFDKVTDAYLLISHQVKDSEPGLVAQSLEEPFEVELRFSRHTYIFALTDVTVKHIFVVTDMFCGGIQCQSSCWIQ